MILPFVGTKTVVNGKSYGLSSASYDVRIAHDLHLEPGQGSCAWTIERFCIPDNVCAYPYDKSSFARVLVTAFNTLFDPGFRGVAQLELVNLGPEPVEFHAGDPVCQFVFHWLDHRTVLPYRGKYQNQPAGLVGQRHEAADGSWVQRAAPTGGLKDEDAQQRTGFQLNLRL